MADTIDLKSVGPKGREGSSPSVPTVFVAIDLINKAKLYLDHKCYQAAVGEQCIYREWLREKLTTWKANEKT